MALTALAAYRIAGKQFSDEDFDKDANIEISKLATRTLYISVPAIVCNLSGAGVVRGNSSAFGHIVLPDANTGTMRLSFALPNEWDSGTINLRIAWNTTATSGDLKLTANIRSGTTGAVATAEESPTNTDAALGIASRMNSIAITLAAGDFVKGDVVGLEIVRDPSDGSDTLSADVNIFEISLEITGRG